MDFSKNERFLINFIGKVGCATIPQINYIMKKFLEIGESQTNYIINRLINNRIVRKSNEGDVIVAEVNANLAYNRNMLDCLNVAVSYMDSPLSVTGIIIPNDGADIKFISNKQLLQIVHIDEQSLAKLLLVQEKYNNQIKENEEKAGKQLCKTIFVASELSDEDLIFEMMEQASLEMPHTLAILTDKYDANNIQVFDKYEKE